MARLLLSIRSLSRLTETAEQMYRGLNANCEATLINKWIPISLLVFLGIYLLTTNQVSVTPFPDAQVAGDIAE